MEGVPSPPAGLSSLPPELGDYIASFLTNRDIKSLRLTSSSVCRTVTLRLERVFIGANPRNIQVAYEVANHETFRKRVKEIIWDETYFNRESVAMRDYSKNDWYTRLCRDEIGRLAMSKGRPGDAARMRQLAAAMGPVESIEVYKELLRGQSSVLESGADVKAFEYALNRFTSLRPSNHLDQDPREIIHAPIPDTHDPIVSLWFRVSFPTSCHSGVLLLSKQRDD